MLSSRLLLLLQASVAAGLRIVSQPVHLAARAPARAHAPHAILVDAPAALPPVTTTLLAAEDVFGEVFMAGMSIALASVAVTIFVGFVIRGNYDNIEQSFFDRLDDRLDEDAALTDTSSEDAVDNFFGSTVPQPKRSPPAAEPSDEPTVQ